MLESEMLEIQQDSDKPHLLTVGYEGAKIDDFIATLLSAKVTTLVDVRELPLSRKKGFSKNALRTAVEAAGISYLHIRQLGDPKPGRDAAKAGDYKTFRKIFGAHMLRPETKQALKDLADMLGNGLTCLLCFERCHRQCHRTIVADELQKLVDFKVQHIGVRQGIADHAHYSGSDHTHQSCTNRW